MNINHLVRVFNVSIKHMVRNSLPAALISLSLISSAFIFMVCMALISSIAENTQRHGAPMDSMVVFRKGADNELGSYVSKNQLLLLDAIKDSYKNTTVRIFGELATVINAPKDAAGIQGGNLILRGIEREAVNFRALKVVDGNLFRPGYRELVVGKQLQQHYPQYSVGKKVRLAGEDWTIVGVFQSELKIAEQELMGDLQLIQALFLRGGSYTTLLVNIMGQFDSHKLGTEIASLTNGELGTSDIETYYSSQMKKINDLITWFGISVSILVLFGAVMGVLLMALILLKSKMHLFSILFSLGIRRSLIERAWLLESACIALISGLIASVLTIGLFDGTSFSTMNISSMNQVSFRLDIGIEEVMSALLAVLAIGLFTTLVSIKRVSQDIRLID